ncbi:hypothetical protein EYZ11_008662 [Aspergillus tanneri]|uniref:Uncharacterized protein n=1 Tax=Aspergillus tanneri TaxID=1220188 RepID=A0A4S3JAC0_9EURO|nr:uncharacterized protein ATNIH1004_005909 [Aspergillus tanneri]KAA8647219.1 hypothetical protein ATNIH1004_005909 [Aspergillus tanneri]THC91885.1 hypothetical protein EYZ11_008662 [Aspergillus tanneri]
MVLLVTTAHIVSAFEDVPSSRRQELDLPDSLTLEAPISHKQLIRLARYFRTGTETNISNDDRSLNSLLRGTKVYVPPPPKKPEPSPEYLALKARLLAAVEADEYNRMTSPTMATSTQAPASIFSSSTPMLSAIHESMSSTDDTVDGPDALTPSLVLNIFLSVLITGFSVYWALTSFHTPDLLFSLVASTWRLSNQTGVHGVSEPVRILLSFLAALVVCVAEVLIYAIYLRKVEQARAREKRIPERKVVVESDVVSGTVNTKRDDAVEKIPDGNKEEIWGRGPNGGLRRRVRERWEEKENEKKDGE